VNSQCNFTAENEREGVYAEIWGVMKKIKLIMNKKSAKIA